MTYIDVILPLPLKATFTYAVDEDMAQRVKRGCRVLVPLGKKKHYTGIVEKVHHDTPGGYEVKYAFALLEEQPVVLPNQLKLWEWIADYYMCAEGDVYNAAVPAGLKLEFKPKVETHVRLTSTYRSEEKLQQLLDSFPKRAVKQQELLLAYLQLSDFFEGGPHEVSKQDLMAFSHLSNEVFNALVNRGVFETYPFVISRLTDDARSLSGLKPLNNNQQRALDEIKQCFENRAVCLLYGVTSSGKTEIYTHLIEETIRQGKQVLYLLPEIALTTQITERLKRVFGSSIGIYHSKFSDPERVEIWNKQLSDDPYMIILGARSSVFLPYQQLGLVIVDEEHESSYKQQDPAPRYHARNTALMLASMYGAKTLLGTATPSVESWYNATEAGKYGLVELKERYQEMQLPDILPVDIKELHRKKMMYGHFSPVLKEKMEEALARHEQIILFQNRRGFAPMIECHDCGWVPKCVHCDVSLTLHKYTNQLVCHYCGYTTPVPHICPECGSQDLRNIGFGTEKVEDEIKEMFPHARVMRMDLDTTRSKTAYEKMIRDFEKQRTDILIGTQMVSKGLDFDHVRLVGILNADTMLNYPDFRAYERAYQLMAQVAGRAGRKGERGLVVLQTGHVDYPIISHVIANDFESMVQAQLSERQVCHFPPFYRLVYIYIKHRDRLLTESMTAKFTAQLVKVFGSERVNGPMQPAVARVHSLHIGMIMLKIESTASMARARELLLQVQHLMMQVPQFKSLQVYYDVDPV
ncbi:MAG: primosomal protein N' [Bacteroidaceae bacterium]|nr:primosomal protein N' [Bacteroidaceae bacterium]